MMSATACEEQIEEVLPVLIAAKPTPSVMPTKNFPSRRET